MKYHKGKNYVRIDLSGTKTAKVSIQDAYLAEFKWIYQRIKKKEYAFRYESQDGQQVRIYLHREIMAPPRGMEVDHISGDGLDNRRENLRVVTKQQNLMNTPPSCRNRSGYKGVSWSKRAKKWVASIRVNKKTRNLGFFDTKERAAYAYDMIAEKIFGQYAYLNRPFGNC